MDEEILTGDIINDDEDDEVECITSDIEPRGIHPSTTLNDLLNAKGYAGAPPKRFKVVRTINLMPGNYQSVGLQQSETQNVPEVNLQKCSLCEEYCLNTQALMQHMLNRHRLAPRQIIAGTTLSELASTVQTAATSTSSTFTYTGMIPATVPAVNDSSGSFETNEAEMTADNVSNFVEASGSDFLCKKCWRKFSTALAAENHVLLSHLTNHVCNVCGEHFLDFDMLLGHLKTFHPERAEKAPEFLLPEGNAQADIVASTSAKSPEIIDLVDDDSPDEASVDKQEHHVSVSVDKDKSILENPRAVTNAFVPNYEKYVSKDGNLTAEQIRFADTMIEKLEKDGMRIFQCLICLNALSNSTHARNHVRSIHLKERFTCSKCPRKFPRRHKLSQHMREDHRVSFPGQSVTIIQSKIYVNSTSGAAPVLNEPASNRKQIEVEGVHPSEINKMSSTHVVSSEEVPGHWECQICHVSYPHRPHAVNHVRMAHLNTLRRCPDCGYCFSDLVAHAPNCDGTLQSDAHVTNSRQRKSKTPTIKNINSDDEMKKYLEQLTSVMNANLVKAFNGKKCWKCKMCFKEYDTKLLAQSHIWMDHLKACWTKYGGEKFARALITKFSEAQALQNNSNQKQPNLISDDSSDSAKNNYVYAGYIDKMQLDVTNISDSLHITSSNIVPDEQVTSGPVIVGEPISVGLNEDGDSWDTIDASVDASNQCEIQFSEGGDFNSVDESVPVEKSMEQLLRNRSAIISSETSLVASEKVPQKNSAPSAVNRDELNKRALRFIKDRAGRYYCIVCQESSKLRTTLVDHVREAHLLSNVQPTGEGDSHVLTARRFSDPDSRKTCAFCEEEFSSVISRENHEIICARTTEPFAAALSAGSGKPSSKNASMEERAFKFVKPDKWEFVCTICEIRATKLDRLLNHVISVHFGDDIKRKGTGQRSSFKCGACGKAFNKSSTRNRHASQCKHAKLKSMGRSLRMLQKSSASTTLAGKTATSEPIVDRSIVNALRRRLTGDLRRSSISADSTDGPPSPDFGVDNSNSSDADPTPVMPKVSTQQRDQRLSVVSNTRLLRSRDKTNSSDEQREGGVVPFTVGDKYCFLQCSICDVLITGSQNAQEHLKNMHGGKALHQCQKCEAAFLDLRSYENHQNTQHGNGDVEQPQPEVDSRPVSPDICCSEYSPVDGSPCPIITASTEVAGHNPVAAARADELRPPATTDAKKKKSQKSLKSAQRILKKYSSKKVDLKNSKSAKKLGTAIVKPTVSRAGTRSKATLGRVHLPSSHSSALNYGINYETGPEKAKKLLKILKGRSFGCKKCPKLTSKTAFGMLIHIRVQHLKEKPYQCFVCNSRFTTYKSVKIHSRKCAVKEQLTGKNRARCGKKTDSADAEGVNVDSVRCKLCEDVLSDIPMMRYHLVSKHYAELQAMGKADKLFDEKEKIAESLSIAVKALKTTSASGVSGQPKGKITASKPNPCQKLGPEKKTRQISKKGAGPLSARKTKAVGRRVPDQSQPVRVNASVDEVLKSLQGQLLQHKSEYPKGMKVAVVSLRRMRFQHPFPDSLRGTVQRAIEKLGVDRFECKLCRKQLSSIGAASKHVKALHLGMYYDRCGSCQKYFEHPFQFKNHVCRKDPSGASTSVGSTSSVETKTQDNMEHEAACKIPKVNEVSAKSHRGRLQAKTKKKKKLPIKFKFAKRNPKLSHSAQEKGQNLS